MGFGVESQEGRGTLQGQGDVRAWCLEGARETHDDTEASSLNGWWEDEICSAEEKLFGDESYEFSSSPSFYCIRGHFLDETSPRFLLCPGRLWVMRG